LSQFNCHDIPARGWNNKQTIRRRKRKMKKLLAILMSMALVLPMALAIDTGSSLGITIETEDFEPLIWQCDSRVVLDDHVESGRTSAGGASLVERDHNYAFEGEQIGWEVLVMDKNGVEKIKDVFVTVGGTQANGSEIEANCDLSTVTHAEINASCNARIGEEELTVFDGNTMAYYTCLLTVESPTSMLGEFWITSNVEDLDGQLASADENEYWYLNPVVAVTLSGSLSFGTVRPGTAAYSPTITVGNGATPGSGVMMDMFITGTDFTDPAHSGAKCPTTNQLSLSNLRYHATSGAYSSATDALTNTVGVVRAQDAEDYMNIEYGDYFSTALYADAEVLQAPAADVQGYYSGNVLSPGAEMSVTFRLMLPEPCNGDFTDGSIFFWGEAV